MIRHRLTIALDDDEHLSATPFWRRGKVLSLSFTESGLVASTNRAAAVTLPWSAYLPEPVAAASNGPGDDSWTIGWWTSGQAGRFGVSVITRGELSESTQEIAAATQTRVRTLDLRRSGHKSGVVLPVLPGASEFSRYEAERSTIAAMCHVLCERTDLRHRLEEPARMQRLASVLQRTFMPARSTPQKPAPNTADVLRAMRQAGYVHPFGRPLSRADIDRSTLVVDEVRTRLLTDPHRSGRPINAALIDRLVHSHYLDVEPWPFAALTGPV
ncbi:MAG: hypothetical protein RLZZ362_892 [Actinomycetota bacterium]|jgi:hypothetical protein